MIYDKNGDALLAVYDKDGERAQYAYDAEGTQIFPDGPVSLRVANYNVGGWYTGSGTNVPAEKEDAYWTMQSNVISSTDADILCLEEYWTYFSGTTRAATLLTSFYPYTHGVNGTSTYFGRCICSKYPILDYTENYFQDDANRYYDVATISVNDETIKVIVTHLTNSSAQARVNEANVIHDYIEAQGFEKYIVCGDFNVGVTSPLSEYNIEVFGQFLEDGASLANGGDFGLFETYSRNSTYTDNLTVDNIIVSGAFMIDDVGVNMTKVNFQATNGDKIDHIPLVAQLTLGDA